MTTVRKIGPGFDRLAAALKSMSGHTAKIGWFENSQYADGTPVAYVAAIQEFGYPTGGIPPRPFLRPTVAEKADAWLGNLADGASSVLRGERQAVDVLEAVALLAAFDISKAIASLQSPALSPATIAAKGFAKPLIDTGLMFKSVTGVVEKNKTEIVRVQPNLGEAAPR